MGSFLITGATGNVGLEVLRSLQAAGGGRELRAGVRDMAQAQLSELSGVKPVRFDFADASSFGPALAGVEAVFLLLPPGLPDAEARFQQLVAAARAAGGPHLVFMSVQGAERNRFIPHHKLEKLLVASRLPYTFLRPAYFMQNFNTTLRKDVVERHRIFLPAGQARFTLIDVRDIGQVAAVVLQHPAPHAGQAYALTAAQPLTFEEMAAELSRGLGRPIRYESPNPLRFFLAKKQEGTPTAFVLVLIMLHYLPRFQRQPPVTDWVQRLTGHAPRTFAQYVHDYRSQLTAAA